MPQCQHSYRYIDAANESGDWVCPGWEATVDNPGCAGGEVYRPDTSGLGKYVSTACKFYSKKLNVPASIPPRRLVLLGVRPQVMEERDGSFTIYLEDGTDYWQLRSQAGHEAFHMVATPMSTFHWLHEGLAEYASWRLMERSGDPNTRDAHVEHAAKMYAEHREGASGCSRALMQSVDKIGYPPHFYDQAFMTVQELLGVVEWKDLMSIAELVPADREVLHHIDFLDDVARDGVERVLAEAAV